MTVAIAMACLDGVLVASDSMGSSGTIATEMQKVRALTTRPIVWVASGSAYVGQRIEQAIELDDVDSGSGETPRTIAEHLRPVIVDAYSVPVAPPGGKHADSQAHGVDALILGWLDDKASFVHLGPDVAPVEQKHQSFVAIGSGHQFADVAYATLSHHVDGQLTLEEGTLLAYRIISTVCRVSSWGVALPVQIAVADAEGARVLSAQEIEQIDTGMQRWLHSEASEFRSSSVSADPTGDLPSFAATLGTVEVGAG